MATSIPSRLLQNAKQLSSVVRLHPFDVSSPEGRSQERYRRAILTMSAASLSRIVSISAGLISVPLTLKYLGPERYGLWMTISSLIIALGFSDLGLGNGLLNGISRAHGIDDRNLARQYVSSACLLLTAIATVVGVAFALTYPRVPWAALFRIRSPQAILEVGPAIAVFIGCFVLNLPAGIVTRIQIGYQDGWFANLWSSLGSVLCLGALLTVIHYRGTLPLLVLAVAGAPVLALLLNGMFVFLVQRPYLLPSCSSITREACNDLWKLGAMFFTLQLAVALSYSCDNFIIARILGPEAVTQYAVPCKLFSLVGTIVSLIVSPLWPAYGEALAKQDHPWIRQTLVRSVTLAAALSVSLATLLLLFGNRLIALWVGTTIHASPLLIAGLAIWSILISISTTIATFCNGLSMMRFQLIIATTATVANITLSVYLTRRIGIPGVVYGSIISQLLFILIPSMFYLRRYLRISTQVRL